MSKAQELKELIEQSSPLYEYWNSQQTDEDEKQRIEKSIAHSSASSLFRKEPYKWEVLYQSIIREISKGDKDSIKGLKVLISMLRREVQDQVSRNLSRKELFSAVLIKELSEKNCDKSPTQKNRARFLRILLAIFTNPYGIEIKRKKKHIYEQTGSALNALRKWLYP